MVLEAGLGGVQEEPTGAGGAGEFAIAGKISVGLVADNRQPALGALHPQLVAAARAGLEAQEGQARFPKAPSRDAHPAFGGDVARASRGAEAALATLHGQHIPPKFKRGAGATEDEGEIDLSHLLPAELGADLDRQILPQAPEQDA